MNYTDRIATLADIILDSARILLDPGNTSAQGRSSARARAHAKLTQALTAMVSMAQATEAYALAIEESALEPDEDGMDGPDGAPLALGEERKSPETGSDGRHATPDANCAGTVTSFSGEPNYARYS